MAARIRRLRVGGARVICAVAALSLLVGCLRPRHELPRPPIPAQYPAEYTGDPAAGARALQLGWREFFADQRLAAFIEAALQRNRDLAVAVAQIEEVRGLYRVQRADLLPTIEANAAAARTRLGPQSVATGALGGGLALSPQGDAARRDAVLIERYSLGAALSVFELDFWGRVRNLTAAARSEFLATVQAERAFRLSLIREVSLTYLSALEAAARVELAEATVQSRREGLRIARRRLEAGVTSELDYRQAETLLTQAETELAALRLAHAQSQNLLTALVGGPIEQPLPPPARLEQQTRVQTLAAGLPAELLTTRPDIIAAEQRLRAARANVGAARAAFLPAITLTGSYGYASTELEELVGDDGRTWSFGPTITLPLFDFGRRRAALTVAEARSHAAVANYERTIQTAFQEVANALAGRRYLAEQVAAQQRATQAQRRLAELARTRYREGVVSYLEVLDAERNLFAAEQALLQVRRAEAANLVTLYVALGGGVLER